MVERVGQVVDFGAVSRKGPCWMFGRAVPPAVSMFAGGRLPVTAPGDAPVTAPRDVFDEGVC